MGSGEKGRGVGSGEKGKRMNRKMSRVKKVGRGGRSGKCRLRIISLTMFPKASQTIWVVSAAMWRLGGFTNLCSKK